MCKIDEKMLEILRTKNNVKIRLYIKNCYFFEYEKIDLSSDDLLKISEFVKIIYDSYYSRLEKREATNDIFNSYLKLYEKYQDEKMKPYVSQLLNNFDDYDFKFNKYFIDKFNKDIDNVILIACISSEIALEYILEKHQFNNEFLDKVLCHNFDKITCPKSIFIGKKFPNLITKILTNEIDDKTIIIEIFNADDLKVFKQYVEMTNHKIDISDLETACCNKSVKIVKYILSNKIIPTKECLDNVLCDNNLRSIEEQQELVNLLIEHGYTPTYEDIIELTKQTIEINKFDEFDFSKQDNGELLKICIERKFTPKYYSKLKSGSTELKIDENLYLTDLKKYLKKGIKLNINNLRDACKYCNDKVINYMFDLGLKPDLECLKNAIYCSKNSKVRSIFDKLVGSIEINPNKKEKLEIELSEIPEDFNRQKLIKLNKKLIDSKIFDRQKKNKFTFNQIKDSINICMEVSNFWNDEDSELSLDNEIMYQLINPDKKKIKIPRNKLDELIYTIIKN
jgi:hypothetical protein